MAASSVQRPRFNPSPCDVQPLHDVPPLQTSNSDFLLSRFQSLVSCPVDVSLELFDTAVSQFIHHPEYNSTLILRSETVSDSETVIPTSVPHLEGYYPVRNVHRKLLPRRPGRDTALEQHCTLYAFVAGKFAGLPSTLVLTPLIPEGEILPYYHPAVSHLAFRFIPSSASTSSDSATLRMEAIPLPGTPTDLNSRLYRTVLALLETLHRYLWGALTHYQKRVQHDVLIPREVYQDVYLKMRERHKGLVNTWKETTDPLKHVFEDIGIATFLMLLWKDMFAASPDLGTAAVKELDDDSSSWKSWPRPSRGFLDLGCGNGLLTHILSAEGYSGYGIDLRARTSWAHYPQSSQASLRVHALDPTQLLSSNTITGSRETFLKPGIFLIGNHADELTPWISVLATLTGASGYLSIPCCAWMFDERFTRSSAVSALEFSDDELGPAISEDEDEAAFIASLCLGAEGTHKSQYSAYRIWLARLSRWLGWKIECDTLRIPSTRNWAIVGRERLPGDQSIFVERAKRIVEGVVRRGAFKTRTPEGKDRHSDNHG